MDGDVDGFLTMFESAGIDTESLTVVLVAGGSAREVLSVLGADSDVVELDSLQDIDFSAYAVAEVEGGVIAFEHTGYADPSVSVLAALSELGGASAVTRSNIQAHERFGCARGGVVEFDSHEFRYVEEDEKAAVPAELRPLFESAWIDPEADEDDLDAPDAWVGMEMAVLHTGVRPAVGDLRRAIEAGYHRVRSLTYLEE